MNGLLGRFLRGIARCDAQDRRAGTGWKIIPTTTMDVFGSRSSITFSVLVCQYLFVDYSNRMGEKVTRVVSPLGLHDAVMCSGGLLQGSEQQIPHHRSQTARPGSG
jgi:hypothetical protein